MQPLAERLRPKSLDEYIGQEHLVGKSAVLRTHIERGRVPSMILWGPPGVGKTTLAHIISQQLDRPFYTLSAISSGVKDVRKAIEQAQQAQMFNEDGAILFIDEIHRFSKSQQDSLLGAVEAGIVKLIGATTENPSFEVITPLLSRCQVYVLNSLTEEHFEKLLTKATLEDTIMNKRRFQIEEKTALFRYSGGDARKFYNIIELLANNTDEDPILINDEHVTNVLQSTTALYDKQGEQHYDIISAFIKSVRGSDPNASVYWLARMLEGGEDVKFIARRLLILAAEDIGLANPNALLIANTCFEIVHKIGMPEARIPLSEATIYLANSPKSNSAYLAIDKALALVRETGDLPVPLHLRNAPTKLMKELNYGKTYKYSHDFPDHFVDQQYLPDKLDGNMIYKPQKNRHEAQFSEQLQQRWKKRYKF
ncbi:MAG: replication-associated recombination protein A [Salinivirgaceae bacterium]|jgi:putative ATPase|nr:replication-associated recombination protein A [Salinivirgaceae bacterium]